MRLLLHICCAPCTVYPIKVLRSDGHDICGLFYNPNIHPYREYKQRLDTLKTYADRDKLNIMCPEEYNIESFLRNIAFREKDRCRYCYFERLNYTALRAKEGNFSGFTTTLLYSKYQDHEIIKNIGKNVALEHKISFYYQDFRVGWQEGIKISKAMGLYRQPYCGCIYSEKERFYSIKRSVRKHIG